MADSLSFTKMHGCGNDYVYVNCLKNSLTVPAARLARKVSDRHFGVGSDGLVLILPSEKADFRMQMFNADGSEGAMCGNALRCVAKFLYDKGIAPQKKLTIETKSGPRLLEVIAENNTAHLIRVDMGEPIFDAAHIPVTLHSDQIVQVPFSLQGEELQLTALSVGNPHAVFFVDEITDHQVLSLGPKIECHDLFPDRINVEFASVKSRHCVEMRVWERGSGETYACGTGACAVAIAGNVAGLLDTNVKVHLRGGVLDILWADDNRIYMTGDAKFVFEGELDLSILNEIDH